MTTVITIKPINPNLGRLVGLIEKQLAGVDSFLDDPITRASGCADEFLPGVVSRTATHVENILLGSGYSTYDQFLEEVRDRTSGKWVYFYSSLSMLAAEEHGPFFDRFASEVAR